MIYFVQPALPKYRVPFFNNLSKSFDIKVFTSYEDFLGVKSIENISYVDYLSSFINIFNKIFWMKGLPLFSPYNKGDVVVISGNPRIINCMMLFAILKIRGIKTVWWGQGWTAGSKGISSKIRRTLMLLADGIAVYTEQEERDIKHKNIIGLNNGIDIQSISVIEKEKNISDNIIRLVFIGRLTEKSNLSLLLKSLSKINSKYHLDIVGDGDIKECLKNLAKELDISSNITWHGKVFDDKRLSEITSHCDIFIYPGAVGLSLIHAFALSLPALVHSDKSHHMPEFAAFKEDYNGVSFLRDNVESLSSVIESLDKNKLIQMSRNARNTVKESFNTEDMANRFCALIRKVNEKNIN